MNPARSIAAGIVQLLQAQDWAAGLTILRAYRADWELKNLEAGVTKITVMPGGQDDQRITRKDQDCEFTIRVLVQTRLAISPNADGATRNTSELEAVDPMFDLFDLIGKLLFETKTAGPGRWMSDTLMPIIDKDLHLNSCYSAMRAITYRVFADSQWAIDNLAMSAEDFVSNYGSDGLEVSP